MQNQTPGRTSWGRPRDFVLFGFCVTVIGIAAAMRWRALDMTIGFTVLGFYLVGSAVLLLRLWKHRAEPGQVMVGQLGVLPPSWRRWVLGENKDRSGK
jgi:hypothetical protein